jgi:TetR/AcrR family transcriptional regulator, transcriptional repressor of bet genes
VPKQVDHHERRQQIAEAVCRLAGRQGLESVTLRHVAAEAEVSMGRVQHYFTTKDEMLLFAFQTISRRVEQRMVAAITALGEHPTTKEFLRAFLFEMLPLSEQAKLEAPVLAAFLARAVVEPKLVESQREGHEQLRAMFTERIRAANGAGDPHHEAVTLLAIVDGLMTQLLVGHVDEDTARSTVDYHLDRVLGG